MSALSQSGANVGIGKGAPDDSRCRELGLVYGSGWGSDWASGEERIKSAQNELRNKAAQLGGNFVIMDVVSGGPSASISGRALLCEKAPHTKAVAARDGEGDEDPHRASGPIATPEAASAPLQQTTEQRIVELNELHDKGLITDSEYQERRKAVVDSR
jgi:hypothetical protein